MTNEQKAALLELAADDPETQQMLSLVLEALPWRGDDLRMRAASLELLRAKCIVGHLGTPIFWVKAAEFFDDLRRVCWALWRL